MNNEEMRNTAVFWLLLAFILSWAGSEVLDSIQREKQAHKVNDFIAAGARFTAGDGYRLCKRIQHLERQHHAIDTVEQCKIPEDYEGKQE